MPKTLTANPAPAEGAAISAEGRALLLEQVRAYPTSAERSRIRNLMQRGLAAYPLMPRELERDPRRLERLSPDELLILIGVSAADDEIRRITLALARARVREERAGTLHRCGSGRKAPRGAAGVRSLSPSPGK